MQKVFRWTQSKEAVKRVFLKHAAGRYKDFVYDVKKKWLTKKQQDLSVPDHVFQEWRKVWEDPDYKKKCEKWSINRRSKLVGSSTGMSTHTCGSWSMRAHERELVFFSNTHSPFSFCLCHTCSFMII